MYTEKQLERNAVRTSEIRRSANQENLLYFCLAYWYRMNGGRL